MRARRGWARLPRCPARQCPPPPLGARASSITPRRSGPPPARRRGRRSRAPRTPPGRRPPTGAIRSTLLEEQRTRVPELLPIRHGRMLVSPFTFFRGAAGLMAADLAATPRTGLHAQLCGDAHLSNFGAFATPDRRLVVRPQRLRRDAARAVRVGRQAARRQLRRRRPRPAASTAQQRERSSSPSSAPTARRCASSPRCARSTSGTRASTWRTSPARCGDPGDGEAAQALRAQRRQGAREGQHARLRASSPTSSTASRGSSATRR